MYTFKFSAITAAIITLFVAQASAQNNQVINGMGDVIVASGIGDGGGASMPPHMRKGVVTVEPGAITTSPLPAMIRKVTVLFESSPTDSSIIVNGIYIGATPLQVTLKEGVHNVKISKRGFLDWEHPVKAYSGLYVSANLVKESTIKREVSENATAVR